ncbi:hypothetical protein [Micromonospora sp. A200]|uniref:hypothetical protein n=1 Tax=Micromonospora sp. A200 TaxID=2940568 RepID=UPI0024747FA3|nr:hypothetical protein [Micromonospora sp. A200]
MAGRAEKGLDRFGDSLDATEKDAADLDRQIAEVEGSLKTLAVAFARTSDAADRLDISKAMRKQQAELRKLTKSKDFLPDFGKSGEEAASGFAASFVARLGPLMARVPMAGMNPAGLAIAAPLAAGAAVVVGTAVAGAVVGGVGIGGVIGGIKLAGRDARVKAASKELGDEVGQVMGRASVSFVPETLDAIGEVRSTVRELEPDFRRAFGAASDHLEPLTQGLLNAGKNALPGVIDALERGGPVIHSFADGFERLGDAAGDSLSDLSEHADEGAHALTLLFATMDHGIQATTDLLGGMAMLYGASEKLSALWTGGGIPTLAAMIAEEKNADAASRGLAGGLGGVMDAAVRAIPGAEALNERQKILNGTMQEGIAAAGGLSAAFDRINGVALTAREAESNYQAAVDAVTASIKEHGKTLDTDTAAGRANDQQIRNLITTARERAQAVYDNTLATKGQAAAETAAKATFEQSRAQLIRNLTTILGNAGAARKLADEIMKIPKKWDTKYTANTGAAEAAAKRLKARIDEIDRRIDIKATLTTSYGGGAHTGQGYSTGMSEGGPVIGRGPKGVDSEPRMLAPGEHVWTDEEVDAAGGHGAMERMRAAIRGGGSSPRGAAPFPAHGGGHASGGALPPIVFRFEGIGNSAMERMFLGWLTQAIRNGGGNYKIFGLGGNY